MLSITRLTARRTAFSVRCASEKRIHLWAMPRTSSTSLLYSFAQRGDAHVFDEPLYASWLAKHPDQYRPYRDSLVAQSISEERAAVSQILLGEYLSPHHTPGDRPLRFFKHIANQCPDDLSFLKSDPNAHHVFLARHPAQVLQSYTTALGGFGNAKMSYAPWQIGLEPMERLMKHMDTNGIKYSLLSNADLITRPEPTLRALCHHLDVPFLKSMLSWKKGGIPEDGLWAKWWYTNSHNSTGFCPSVQDNKGVQVPEALRADLLACLEIYNRIIRKRLWPLPVLPDERNRSIIVSVGGKLVPRIEAKVSVFDSSVQGGDAVWEGLRIKNGRIFDFDTHMNRMIDSAKTLMFHYIPSKEEITEQVVQTLKANNMRDGAHIRLTLTRGEKVTSGMSPTNNQSPPCLIVLAEWKDEASSVPGRDSGLKLITSAIRRNTPSCLDSKIHHNNLLNNIMARIQANNAKMDDALMLDTEGYVAETSAMNFFIVKDGIVKTSFPDYCLPGITRAFVIDTVAPACLLPVKECRLSLTDVYTADEAFTTGTMGALSPVVEIDSRPIGDGTPGPLVKKMQQAYEEAQMRMSYLIPEW